ncbi:MAG TPA: hypothetical protein VKB78_14090 [Pirellulales bacterium]|nr:hypothetical protein [Pirellulales bacterium]
MFSFDDRKKHLEVQSVLRRIIDASAPNRATNESEARWDSRSNRTLPLVLCPWQDGKLCLDGVITAVTKNVSSQGLTAIVAGEFAGDLLVAGFSLEGEHRFIIGALRHRTPLGGGFWQLGIELTRLIAPGELPGLERLLPITEALTVA